MNVNTVGAGILSIVTESLYDNPIVVFREYIQNSVDALFASQKGENTHKCAKIISNDENLYFLDNGTGILKEKFLDSMQSIANSGKRKTKNLGYKGIGRLSGISYCKKLTFINVLSYEKQEFQQYDIDCLKFTQLQKSENFGTLSFEDLMKKIGICQICAFDQEIEAVKEDIQGIFTSCDAGFIVVLKNISQTLRSVIEGEDFVNQLSWLLPLPFRPELIDGALEGDTNALLFEELSNQLAFETGNYVAKGAKIYYNDIQLFRPIKQQMLRTYTCRSNFEQYAVCMHSFSNEKIKLDSKNDFSGIRLYMDNMLLCDENELIPALIQSGCIQRGNIYEMLQSVRGIGAMIYIVDKDNISANARRTFIDLTDGESFSFLGLLGNFVDSIYTLRYALSYYQRAKNNCEETEEKVNSLRLKAQLALEDLAKDTVVLEDEFKDVTTTFDDLQPAEQRRVIKNAISKQVNSKIKEYMKCTDTFDFESCFDDFKTWLYAK